MKIIIPVIPIKQIHKKFNIKKWKKNPLSLQLTKREFADSKFPPSIQHLNVYVSFID